MSHDTHEIFGKRIKREMNTNDKNNGRVQDRKLNLQYGDKTQSVLTMSPEHQAYEQLNLAGLSTFQLDLKAFFDCLVL